MRISWRTSAAAAAGVAVLALAATSVGYAATGSGQAAGHHRPPAGGAAFQTFLAGRSGDTLDETTVFRLRVKPGVYDLRLQGAFTPVQQDETGLVECFVTDGQLRKVYAGSTSTIGVDGIPLPSAANAVRIPRGTAVLVGCFATAPVTYLQPLAVSFEKAAGQRFTRATEVQMPPMKLKHGLGPRV
jgi:hypothetical protein